MLGQHPCFKVSSDRSHQPNRIQRQVFYRALFDVSWNLGYFLLNRSFTAPEPTDRAFPDAAIWDQAGWCHLTPFASSIRTTLSTWQTTSWKSSLVEYSQPIR